MVEVKVHLLPFGSLEQIVRMMVFQGIESQVYSKKFLAFVYVLRIAAVVHLLLVLYFLVTPCLSYFIPFVM